MEFSEETYDNRKSCFAWVNKDVCAALETKNCQNCKFYKFILLENDRKTNELIKKFKKEMERKNEQKK